MKILIATGNRDKLQEIAQIFSDHEVMGYHEIMEPFEIIEDGESFQANAIIKAKAIHERLSAQDRARYLILSDDSGISVPLLHGEPGIYSARYAGEPLSSKRNLQKLIEEIQKRGVERTPAHYTAAMAMILEGRIYTVHGWMHGEAIIAPRGERGFGYDPMFIPQGENRTLGEMEESEKNVISHRAKALKLARKLLQSLTKTEG